MSDARRRTLQRTAQTPEERARAFRERLRTLTEKKGTCLACAGTGTRKFRAHWVDEITGDPMPDPPSDCSLCSGKRTWHLPWQGKISAVSLLAMIGHEESLVLLGVEEDGATMALLNRALEYFPLEIFLHAVVAGARSALPQGVHKDVPWSVLENDPPSVKHLCLCGRRSPLVGFSGKPLAAKEPIRQVVLYKKKARHFHHDVGVFYEGACDGCGEEYWVSNSFAAWLRRLRMIGEVRGWLRGKPQRFYNNERDPWVRVTHLVYLSLQGRLSIRFAEFRGLLTRFRQLAGDQVFAQGLLDYFLDWLGLEDDDDD